MNAINAFEENDFRISAPRDPNATGLTNGPQPAAYPTPFDYTTPQKVSRSQARQWLRALAPVSEWVEANLEVDHLGARGFSHLAVER
jgi:hypothetical protein